MTEQNPYRLVFMKSASQGGFSVRFLSQGVQYYEEEPEDPPEPPPEEP